MIRTFIAIELDPPFLRALAQIQSNLQVGAAARAARWVRPEGIHLTLQFLGDVAQDKLDAIYRAVSKACAPFAPFTLTLSALGCFPNLRRPRVIWVGVQDQGGQLAALQKAVERELSCLGYHPEERGFTPHLTLARVRQEARREDIEALAKLVSEAPRFPQTVSAVTMSVERVSVMKSDLQPSGAVYTEMSSQPLGGSWTS